MTNLDTIIKEFYYSDYSQDEILRKIIELPVNNVLDAFVNVEAEYPIENQLCLFAECILIECILEDIWEDVTETDSNSELFELLNVDIKVQGMLALSTDPLEITIWICRDEGVKIEDVERILSSNRYNVLREENINLKIKYYA